MTLLRLVREAWSNLLLHKARSLLAALGIIFGVASVICMLSISEVARRDVIGRIERLGLRNVILDSVKPEKIRQREQSDSEQSWIARYGITQEDLDVLRHNVSEIEAIVPMRIMLEDVQANLESADINVVATSADYSWVMSHDVAQGRFLSPVDDARAAAVCVLGSDAARRLFPLAAPLDQVVQIGSHHFKVIGVMDAKGQTGSGGILSNPDNTAWMPLRTSFSRFGRLQQRSGGGTTEATEVEVNRAVVHVADGVALTPIAAITRNLVDRRHRSSDVSWPSAGRRSGCVARSARPAATSCSSSSRRARCCAVSAASSACASGRGSRTSWARSPSGPCSSTRCRHAARDQGGAARPGPRPSRGVNP
jgi:putative ABC transport system permease protein